jgi:hypothetical protein
MSRIFLTAPAAYFVDESAGSDSNDGASVATAWKTGTHAYAWCRDHLDLGGQKVTIQALTNPSTLIVCEGPLIGQNETSDFLFSGAGGPPITFYNPSIGAELFLGKETARFGITGMTLTAPGSGGFGVVCADGVVDIFNVSFAAMGDAALDTCGPRALINGSQYLVWMPGTNNCGAIAEDGSLVTLNCHLYIDGAVSFADAFVQADWGGMIDATGAIVTPGAATGKRFNASLGGKIFAGNYDPNFFPGSLPGIADASTFGLYHGQ